MTIGERIKEARLRKGLTQGELATLLGYKSRSSINKIEVDGRDIPRSMVVKLAEILGVTPSYLMGWEDLENNGPIYEKYGKALYSFRLEKGYSRNELSEKVGISEDLLRRFEYNEAQPNPDVLERLVNALDVSMNDFLFTGIMSDEIEHTNLCVSFKKREKITANLEKLNFKGLERIHEIILDYLKISEYIENESND